MCTTSGFWPRDAATRVVLARHLLHGTPAPDRDDDGFVAACRAVAGLPNPSPTPAQASALARFGFGLRGAEEPLVSILICTFNRAHWLKEAIASAQAQDWPCEIVVVDDGSSDDTDTVLAATPGVLALRHPGNRGKPAALELGMSACRGEAVIVLDDDDKLLPGAVRALATTLFADETLVAVFGDTLVFDDADGAVLDWKPASRLPRELTRRAVLTTIPAMPGATLVRMSAQLDLAPFEPTLVRGQDMDHYLRLSALGPMAAVPLPIQLYRRHDGLRGAAQARWKKHQDPAEHRRRFLGYVQPVFRDRWQADVHGRDEGFAWALGLAERDLPGLAQQELARWPLPDSPHEAWVRARLGLRTRPMRPDEPGWLVLDDGDEGALHALLLALAPTGPVEVVVGQLRESLGSAQLFWPGDYRLESALRPRARVLRLASSAAPEWRSPPVHGAWLPAFPPSQVATALSAIAGWPLPERTRAVRGDALLPITTRCIQMRSPDVSTALAATADVLERLPTWIPARALAATTCRRAGLTREADVLAG